MGMPHHQQGQRRLRGEARRLDRANILAAVDGSLRRLQTDYIDLYQSHTDDKDAPLEETLAAYDQLMKQGKVRAIGASNYDAPRLAEALGVSAAKKLPRYETLQPHYNMYERADYERALEPLVLKEGIGVIPYYSLASGFLTGKYRSEADFKKSPRGGGAKAMLNERGLRILKALDDVSARLKANPAQVALAWLIARPSITAPIASATNLDQLKDLVAAAHLKLDADAIKARMVDTGEETARLSQLEADVQRNNLTTDEAMLALATPFQVEPALKFLARPPALRRRPASAYGSRQCPAGEPTGADVGPGYRAIAEP